MNVIFTSGDPWCSLLCWFLCPSLYSGAVFVRNPLNRELVATFEIIVSVHDNASDVIDMSVSVPNGKKDLSVYLLVNRFNLLTLRSSNM